MIYRITPAAIGFAAFAALSIAAPHAVQAQSLNITCNANADGATNLCDDNDMAEVEDFVNDTQDDLNTAEEAIAANTDLINDNAEDQADTDAAQDQALADAVTDQAAADANQDQALANAVADQADTDEAQDEAIAQNANDIGDLDDRVTANEGNIDANTATNTTQQTEIDANTATNAAQQTEIDANTATNATQQTEIDANTATNAAQQTEIDTNTAGVAANLATNNAQQIEIDRNTTDIANNATNIQANTDNIATNTADIAQNAADIADLRTDLNQGLAMANAMEVFAPDPGSNFRMNVGTGFHDGEAAFGITGSGRVGATGNTILYFGVAGAEGTTAGKAGISFQW